MKIKTLFICMLILGVDANAKLSSNKIEKQKDKIQNVIDICQFDSSVLEEIKAKSIGSTITSSIATIGSGVSTAASVGALVIDKKVVEAAEKAAEKKEIQDAAADDDAKKYLITDKDKNAKLKTHRIAAAIGSGVATGANFITIGLSGPSLKNIKEQLEISEDCQEAITELADTLNAIK